MKKCWLYIYENERLNSIYIGIADSMSRVYEKHNDAAEHLRDAHGTHILQTLQPFNSREDARKAEAIAIHVAAFAGTAITTEDDDGEVFTVTNLSGVKSTKELGPAIPIRPGTVHWDSLEATAIVPIGSYVLEGRPSPFGGHTGAFLAERTSKYWNVSIWKRTKIRRLIAATTGSGNHIIGDWDVSAEDEWKPSPGPNNRVAFPLTNPENHDPRKIVGMHLEGHTMNSGITYSADLRT